MTLSCRIYTRGTRIDYEFNSARGLHALWFSGITPSNKRRVVSEVAGELINDLIPYREQSRDVRELISWLSGFGPNGGWCKP